MASNYSSGRKAGATLYGLGVLVVILGLVAGLFYASQQPPFSLIYGAAYALIGIISGLSIILLAEAGMAIFDIAENTAKD